MESTGLFHILDQVDSTNNYAMDRIRKGDCRPGMAWFSHFQTEGKGQRGRAWQSLPGRNLALSVACKPSGILKSGSFHLNALVGLVCLRFCRSVHPDGFSLKWPNDLYWNDRKAGGILIESIFGDAERKWAVIGIGLNINQDDFPGMIENPVSLRQITGKNYDPVTLARALHGELLSALEHPEPERIMAEYNRELYMKGRTVRLKKETAVFLTTIMGVDEFGNLLTNDAMERSFAVGEVQWVRQH